MRFGLFASRRHMRQRRRIRRATAAVTAALAATLSVSALAGGAPGHSGERLVAVDLKHEALPFLPPQHAFPMLASPEYGDGIGAGRGHEGQDMFAAAGTPLVAVSDAVVLETGNSGGQGNFISIYDSKADRTYNYLHMMSPAVATAGERVRAGRQLGRLGCTGSCWGDHLHFEERVGRDTYGPVLDPMPFLERLTAG